MTDLGKVYHNSNYARFKMSCKSTKHISIHYGAPPGYYPDTSIKAYSQYRNPGAYGVAFEYRWPTSDSHNYYSNSPTHIHSMFFHYVHASNGNVFTHKAEFGGSDASKSDYYPDRWAKNDGRKSNTFKNAYYILKSSKSSLVSGQHMMCGVTFVMEYGDRGGSKHVRCMDVRNLRLIYDSPGNSNFIYRKAENTPFDDHGKYQGLIV